MANRCYDPGHVGEGWWGRILDRARNDDAVECQPVHDLFGPCLGYR